MSDWWARKLGAQQQQQQQESPPPAYPPQNYPGHQQQQPQSQQLYAQPQPQPFDPTQMKVTPENLFVMAGHWQGGQAHRTDTEPCPECGSNQYFSRASRMSRLPPPAPHCYNCGYNGGLFSQGDPTAWGVTS